MKKICVLGLGYIGLPTASIFATNGFEVAGVDSNDSVVQLLKNGKVHIEEPGLKTLVQAALNSKNLKISSKPEEADVFIIAVPTPFKEDKKPDLSYIESATHSILSMVKKGNLVILESTSPPGTTIKVVGKILKETGLKIGEEIYLSHCPERVLPGKILKELIVNDRVIGGINRKSSELTADLYKTFVQGKIYITAATTAEMVKLVENTYRDLNIAFANELSLICEKIGINVWEVIELANKHPRVNIHNPGPGVGGHCLAVDPWFIVSGFPKESQLIKTARKINDNMPEFVSQKVVKLIKDIENPKVTILGLAYKGDVDDTRESPAFKIIHSLESNKKNLDIQICIYDPHVKYSDYELSSFEGAFKNTDLIILLTDHKEFKYIDPEEVIKLVRKPVILDTKNCINQEKWVNSGFKVINISSKN